jgi:uncharacterized protein YkwD
MPKRSFLLLLSLLIITWSAAACSSEMKMVKREYSGIATLTPFLPKATFTSVNTPMIPNGGTDVINPTRTATSEATFPDETSEVAGTEQILATFSITPTLSGSPVWISATATPITPTATLSKSLNTYTPKPTAATSVPAVTLLPSLTGEPAATTIPSSTSVQTSTPAPTNTSVPSATSIPVGCSFSGNATYENQVIDLINQERMDRGLSAMTQNSSLSLAARRHSEDMACNDFFSHTGSDGSTLGSRILTAGYSYSWAAENIAASSNCSFSAQSVVNMWMNSTGHRNNMLSENAVHIGVGFRCVSDSTSGDLDAYYTADFGRP